MTREELENEIFISVIRDLPFFLFVNRARDPPCTTLYKGALKGHKSMCRLEIHLSISLQKLLLAGKNNSMVSSLAVRSGSFFLRQLIF